MYRSGYVALIGRPNVGKSTLLNRLLGQKLAITSHKPQTTRHRIVAIDSSERGQIVFIDTPGIHRRGDKGLNRQLNKTALASLKDTDLLLHLVEVGVWTEEDADVMREGVAAGRPMLAVVNKVDRLRDKAQMLPFLAELQAHGAYREILPVSAKQGDQCDYLREQLLLQLPEGDPIFPPDQVTDRPVRFFVAELIREQVTRRYHQELPYAVTVEIERFLEQDDAVEIDAVIWVERDKQKAIIIGKGGAALKETGTAARMAIQDLLEQHVRLHLWVKVKQSWSQDEAALRGLGYSE